MKKAFKNLSKLPLVGGFLIWIGKILFGRGKGRLLFAEPGEWRKILSRIEEVRRKIDVRLSDVEAVQLHEAAKKSSEIEGELAEVGAGGSTVIIAEAKSPSQPFHIFDTFTGLPDPGGQESSFQMGQYQVSEGRLKEILSDCAETYFYPGIFPETTEPLRNKKFSLVHLDLDLYKSTYEALRFFYPRLSPGGAILSHDHKRGKSSRPVYVAQAFADFLKDKPEKVVELYGSQCLLIKNQ